MTKVLPTKYEQNWCVSFLSMHGVFLRHCLWLFLLLASWESYSWQQDTSPFPASTVHTVTVIWGQLSDKMENTWDPGGHMEQDYPTAVDHYQGNKPAQSHWTTYRQLSVQPSLSHTPPPERPLAPPQQLWVLRRQNPTPQVVCTKDGQSLKTVPASLYVCFYGAPQIFPFGFFFGLSGTFSRWLWGKKVIAFLPPLMFWWRNKTFKGGTIYFKKISCLTITSPQNS